MHAPKSRECFGSQRYGWGSAAYDTTPIRADLSQMHAEQGLQFRSFVPHMVGCLEDADSNVREAAKAALVELFK